MAWPNIDVTSPAGTDKKKFGDDKMREDRQYLVDGLTAISNYTAAGTLPALKTAVWTTAGRPTGANLVDKVTGFNSTLGYEEYYDLATTTWKPCNTLASWNVAGRPASTATGQYGYNSDLAVIEWYSGAAWVRVSGDPAGKVDKFAMSTAPTGWLKCNSETIGNASSNATAMAHAAMQDLFVVLWTNWTNTILPIQDSTGAPSTRGASAIADFNANKRLPLPELRGEFVRGWDDSRGVDTGRVFGSAQSGAIESHTHTTPQGLSGAGGYAIPSGSSGLSTTSGATGSTETRPRNVALLYCIKY